MVNYWQFTAHIIPGIIVVLQLLFINEQTGFITGININQDHFDSIVFVGLISIPFGLIIDGIHHRCIPKNYKKRILKRIGYKKYLIASRDIYYLPILGADVFKRYYDSFYVASEAYTNIGTSLLISPIFIFYLNINCITKIILSAVMIIIIIFLYCNGYKTRLRHTIGFNKLINGKKSLMNN